MTQALIPVPQVRLDELSDWCLLETLRRDPNLAVSLRTLKFQRHAITRIWEFQDRKDWGLINDDDYALLLARYVPYRQAQLNPTNSWAHETIYCPVNQRVTSDKHKVEAAYGMASMLMNLQQIKAYREAIRVGGS